MTNPPIAPNEVRDGASGEILFYYVGFTENVEIGVIRELRNYFATHVRTTHRRWAPNVEGEGCPDERNIWISGETPDQEREFPSILVQEMSGALHDFNLGTTFGTLVLEDTELEVGVRYGGFISATPSLLITALDTVTLNKVTDEVLYGLAWPVRRELESLDVENGRGEMIIKPNSIKFSGRSSEPRTAHKDRIYQRTVSFDVLSYWYDDFFVNGVNIEQIAFIPDPSMPSTA